MPEAVPSRHARRKARTRGEIYRAAMRLFVARGVDTVTIEEICAEADVARATFFLHFPTKDAVLTEYARQALDELTATLRAHSGSAIEALGAALTSLADRATRQAAVVQLVVREVMARPRPRSRTSSSAAASSTCSRSSSGAARAAASSAAGSRRGSRRASWRSRTSRSSPNGRATAPRSI